MATLFGVILVGCSSFGTDTQAPGGPGAQWQSLPELEVALLLPASASITQRKSGVAVEMRGGFRYPRPMLLTPIDAERPHEQYVRRRVGEQATLHWTVQSRTGGMGGTESVLEGRLLLDGRHYLVQCSDQQEGGAPSLDWCVETLIAARSSLPS